MGRVSSEVNVADKPYFPAPGAAKPPRGSSQHLVLADETQPARAVVMRPEPAPESRKLKATLTKDEVRALIAVGLEDQKSRASVVFGRARWIVVPTGIIGTLMDVFFGDYALVAILSMTATVILWTAWPLIRRDEWS